MGVSENNKLLDVIFGPESRGGTDEERARTSKRKFVRSQDHLAFDNNKATGLRISAWQAFHSYGLEVLKEVVEYGSAILITKPDEPALSLKEQRERLGFTVEDFAGALKIPVSTIMDAEDPKTRSDIHSLCRIAQALTLVDETKLGFSHGAGGDPELAIRMREIGTIEKMKPRTVLVLDEAAWVIAKQIELAEWLRESKDFRGEFSPSNNYGDSHGYPAWQHGYYLANETRKILGLGEEPVYLRELIGKLGIPAVQLELPAAIGGATIAVGKARGIVANIRGSNQNVWVRRATLAHELGHLLWDPDERLKRLAVDHYDDIESLYDIDVIDRPFDLVEARANAFAIEFLAPQKKAQKIFESEPSHSAGLRKVMEYFGISYQAAKYHIWNALDRTIPLENLIVTNYSPTDEWEARESFTLDYFEPRSVPFSRRGQFALNVYKTEEAGLITAEVAALYLGCEISEYLDNKQLIRDFFK